MEVCIALRRIYKTKLNEVCRSNAYNTFHPYLPR